ncbi:universal stress protein [Candidatus Tokpelaia sp.]|uniref:universal stress protein n=1 Tax=Candidatus Tokpelaia sp. TaxID=2233777 RepID=UPI001FEEA742|nr:universal stress protein [Candidatus Tokpelaia sp.]
MLLSERSSRKQGHSRKILAVVDSSPECERAVAYAAAQAESTHGGLVLLYVIDDSDFRQMFGVEHVMRAEAADHARAAMAAAAAIVKSRYAIKPEEIIREGEAIKEITALVEKDSDIALLVLAAGTYHDGPGPLIQALVGRHKAFALPVTVIPANLSDATIDEIA